MTFLEEVTFTSHGGEYQGALFTGEQPGAPAGPCLQFPEGEARPAFLNPSLDLGLPGGCGPPLDRHFRNERKDPLPALK